MKANRTSMLKRDTSAQVGIGTLIIFIAMVLVAAIAAAVLIQTSGVLQQKAQATGEEATSEVSSNMKVLAAEGIRDDTTDLSDNIDLLEVQVSVSAGGSAMDLEQMVISISDGDTTNTLTYNDSANLSDSSFRAEEIRDEDDSFDNSTNPVMNKGDLIRLYISTTNEGDKIIDSQNVSTSNLVLDPRTDVQLTFTPESGTPQQMSFVTPSSYGVDKRLSLYP
ncbi:archaellin/type IV pilin N-terminal domain-containing protein [Methanohalophilus halophilus]|uniref:Flagellin n=1 Tax=Methanohalophilus halophilus TaxID=2177 RepID=A0A1L3Q389_9EURY|nr:archaellin/type IV pilin N-terminal domain-containing protein [Methanohalophilus halophilus]APH39344.1 hypothetical protein BHR79_07535 [Methanohalophilus halophilus]RNI09587.1 flagellin [Methanohalophilus halophilus]SDW48307.1 flagellin FlaB [Methanohalophilus halophilus]